MSPDPRTPQWTELSDQALHDVADWRQQHPHATLKEIEQAVDHHLGRLRARLVQDTAQASPLAGPQPAASDERPRCPQCDRPLQARGKQRRRLLSHQGQDLELDRSYWVCAACGGGVFPPG